MIKAYKLYTGEGDHSYFEEGFIDEHIVSSVRSLHFKETKAPASYDWHRAPQVQYVLTLKGKIEFTISLEETFILRAGEVLIAMDTGGYGHKWKLLDAEPWIRAYAVIETLSDINFFRKDHEE